MVFFCAIETLEFISDYPSGIFRFASYELILTSIYVIKILLFVSSTFLPEFRKKNTDIYCFNSICKKQSIYLHVIGMNMLFYILKV